MPLSWKYDQGRDPRWRVWSDVTREGACFALSTQFIICTANGIGFTKWLNPPEVPSTEEGEKPHYAAFANRIVAQNEIANTIIPRMAEQSRRVSNAGQYMGVKAKYDYAVEVVEQRSNLKAKKDEFGLNFDVLPKPQRNGSEVPGWADEFCKDDGLKYISLTGAGKSKSFNHGIAAIVNNNQWGIFDPNFGIYGAQNKPQFQNDLEILFASEYKARLGIGLLNAQFTTFA